MKKFQSRQKINIRKHITWQISLNSPHLHRIKYQGSIEKEVSHIILPKIIHFDWYINTSKICQLLSGNGKNFEMSLW